jgi:hypothetical protein
MRRAVCLVAVAMWGAGCSEEEGYPPVQQDEFCDAWARTTCDALVRCGCIGGVEVDMCPVFAADYCVDDFMGGMGSDRYEFRPAIAGNCVGETGRLLSDCVIDDSDGFLGWSCYEVFEGIVDEGGACDVDDECVDGLECWADVCTRMPAQGQACLDGWECGEDLYCADGDVCRMPGGAGASCPEGDIACADELWCDPETDTCRPYLGSGGDCSAASWACADDLYCSDTTNLCTPYPTGGMSCADSWEECADGWWCDAGLVCQAQLPDGAACTDDEQCGSWDCPDGYCLGDTAESVCDWI